MKKKIVSLFTLVGLVAFIFVGFSSNWFVGSNSAKAEKKPELSFDEINRDVIQNNESPSYEKTKKIVNTLFNNVSVVDVPVSAQDSIANDVALAYLNGESDIDENNIVNAVNRLADNASAPKFARTNIEQVKVVRTFLHRLVPDIVSSSGKMNDIEAFTIFTATVSQKVDNEDFMVLPEEFTAKMNEKVSQPFPGTPEFQRTEAEITQNTKKMDEMAQVINNYAKSKRLASVSDILNSIGIN